MSKYVGTCKKNYAKNKDYNYIADSLIRSWFQRYMPTMMELDILRQFSIDVKENEECDEDKELLVNSIIDNNIFMTSEYQKLNKIYLNIYDCLFITIIYIIIMFTFIFINYLLIKKLEFIKELILSSSILLCLPKLLITFSGIINNFTYGNKYFSELITTFISTYFNNLFMLSIVGITIVLCLNDFERKYHK